MNKLDATKRAGQTLRHLINKNYQSQAEFAFDFGAELRTVNRYINEGITKVETIQELAIFFNVSLKDFFPDE